MKKRLLFVDDDHFVLAALRRMLRSHRNEWDVEFANGGQQALQRMEERPFDVIVSDMRMPGMDGAELLAEVRQRHPRTVRIILSGQSDEDIRLRAVGPAHQHLSKPCDPEILKVTIARACVLRDRLDNGSLRRLISQIETLPSLPHAYQNLVIELQSGDASIHRVGEIISTDIAMTAKVLQLVNSSFFGLGQRITNATRAVQFIGIRKIEPLALTAGIFSQIDQSELPGLSVSCLVEHSLAVATRARQVAARVLHDVDTVEDAFLAGMLHDVGKLILAVNLPDRYQEVLASATRQSVLLWQAEIETFGASHAEVGAYLAGLWGLPDSVVEAIAFHHDPRKVSPFDFTPLTAVHVANALEHDDFPGDDTPGPLNVDEDYLDELGLLDHLRHWQEQRPLRATPNRVN